MKKNKIQSHGEYSYMATLLVIIAIAWWFGGFYTLFDDIASFVQHGSLQKFSYESTPFIMVFPVLLAVMAMDVLLNVHVVWPIITQVVRKQHGTHSIVESVRQMKQGSHFAKSLKAVVFEELYARMFFLGIMTQLPIFSGTIGYWAMFLIGNSLWAYHHLSNYQDPRDRKLLLVLPQFIGGIFFSYVFIQYGFWATIFVHFGCNAILDKSCPFQKITKHTVTNMVYSVSCAFISYLIMRQDLSDTLAWFGSAPVFILTGWSPWDYVLVSIFFISCFVSVCDLLLYDHRLSGQTSPARAYFTNLVNDSEETMCYLVALFIIGMMVKLLPVPSTAEILFLLLLGTIFATSFQSCASPSGAARSLWSGIPIAYIILCVIQVLSPWELFGWMAVITAMMIPRYILCRFDA